jgi:ribosomal protein L11 methyltransferase
MSDAQFQLVLPACSLIEAEALAEAIDAHIRIEALAVTISEVDEARKLWQTSAYFATQAEASEAVEFLGLAAKVSAIPQEDWVQRSLEGLAPIAAGRFFLHGSHDRGVRRHGGISLEIDAGTAFGTGHHPTTEGCLLAFDDIIKRRRPARVLDLGCGTGVLAIAAARATGQKALATDIDAEAVRVTMLNARGNGVGALLRGATAAGLHAPTIHQAAPFDLIFANILARPLIELAQGLSRLLSARGQIILSGLTRDQIRWVSAAYRNRGLVLERRIVIGNWATLVHGKP